MKDVKDLGFLKVPVPVGEIIGSTLALLGMFFMLFWGLPIGAEVIRLGW